MSNETHEYNCAVNPRDTFHVAKDAAGLGLSLTIHETSDERKLGTDGEVSTAQIVLRPKDVADACRAMRKVLGAPQTELADGVLLQVEVESGELGVACDKERLQELGANGFAELILNLMFSTCAAQGWDAEAALEAALSKTGA